MKGTAGGSEAAPYGHRQRDPPPAAPSPLVRVQAVPGLKILGPFRGRDGTKEKGCFSCEQKGHPNKSRVSECWVASVRVCSPLPHSERVTRAGTWPLSREPFPASWAHKMPTEIMCLVSNLSLRRTECVCPASLLLIGRNCRWEPCAKGGRTTHLDPLSTGGLLAERQGPSVLPKPVDFRSLFLP